MRLFPRFHPVLMMQDVPTAAAFYRHALGFEFTFESDWYLSLRLGACELALLAYDHAIVPEGQGAIACGVILNLEVDDVDAVHQHLRKVLGLQPILELRNEDFGQRHFIVAAPDGVMLDIIQPIEPSAEYADAYTDS